MGRWRIRCRRGNEVRFCGIFVLKTGDGGERKLGFVERESVALGIGSHVQRCVKTAPFRGNKPDPSSFMFSMR